jgi:hypothetical protein
LIIPAFKREAAWMSLLRVLSRGKFLAKNARKPVKADDGQALPIVDAIVVDQVCTWIV